MMKHPHIFLGTPKMKVGYSTKALRDVLFAPIDLDRVVAIYLDASTLKDICHPHMVDVMAVPHLQESYTPEQRTHYRNTYYNVIEELTARGLLQPMDKKNTHRSDGAHWQDVVPEHVTYA